MYKGIVGFAFALLLPSSLIAKEVSVVCEFDVLSTANWHEFQFDIADDGEIRTVKLPGSTSAGIDSWPRAEINDRSTVPLSLEVSIRLRLGPRNQEGFVITINRHTLVARRFGIRPDGMAAPKSFEKGQCYIFANRRL